MTLLINIFYHHLLKAEIVEIEKEEARKNQDRENFCLKKPGLKEECADSLVT